MRLLVASSNEGKIREIRRLLAAGAEQGGEGGRSWEILSLADLARLWRTEELGALPPVAGGSAYVEKAIGERYTELSNKMEETGATFEENAVIKARGAAAYTGLLTLADDSGLEVDFLDGAPGVFSARFAGPGGSEEACNELLLYRMREAPAGRRAARYKAVLVLADPEKVLRITAGTCEGYIGFAPKGSGGFGYDPLFVLPRGAVTMAELPMEEKNRISHRGIALAQMAPFLVEMRHWADYIDS